MILSSVAVCLPRAFFRALISADQRSVHLTFDCFEMLVDEMGSRIDDLEKSISELMAQTGIEEEEGTKKQ